jgi:hypothetical protein
MIILIKTIAIWLIIYSVLILFKPDFLSLMKSIYSKSSLFHTGIVYLFFSIFLLLTNYETPTDYSLIITIISISGIIKSCVIIIFPAYVIRRIDKMTLLVLRIRALIGFSLGVLLLYSIY